MSLIKKRLSLLNQFSLAFVLLILITFTVTGFIFMFFSFSQKNESFERRALESTEAFAKIIANPLWSYDLTAVSNNISVFLENKEVCEVNVYDENNKLIISKSKPCLKSIENTSLEFKVSKEISINNARIGKLEVSFSKYSLKSFVDQFVILMVILVLALSGVLLVGSRMLISHYIIDPIHTLSETIKKIKEGNYSVDIRDETIRFKEFDNLISRINEMIEAINKREEDLKELNLELKSILEAMPDGFVLMDLKGRILTVNNSFLQMFKYSEEQVIGKNAIEFSDESFRINLMKGYFQQAISEGQVTFKWKVKSKDGKSFWILVRLKYIVLKGNKFLIGLILDIDEQEKTKEKLELSEEKFRAFAENTRAAVFLYSEFFEYVNPTTCEILGYTEEELLKMRFWEVVHPEDRELVKQRGMRRLSGEELPYSYEFKVLRKDGKVRWVEFVADRINIKGKKLALGTAIDITRRKIVEQNFKEEKERLAATLKSIAEGVVVINEKGEIILANAPAEKLLGMKESEMSGRNCNEVLVFYAAENEELGDYKKVTVNFKDAVNGFQNDNLVLFNNGGDLVYIAVSASPVTIEQKVIGAVVVIRDITEHELFKNEMIKRDKLEALSTLAAGIAHDFNNLLLVLQGNLDLAFIKADSNLKSFLEKAKKSLDNAKGLAQQLLTFAKGGAPVKKQIGNVAEIIKEITEFVLSGGNIKVDYQMENDIPDIEADKIQLEQVFQNILLNAKDVLKDKSMGIVKIKVENYFPGDKKQTKFPLSEKYERYIHIQMEDNGPGIPEKILDRIFEPYFTTKKTGSGLGLAVAYSIVRKHDGFIMAENGELGGACFHIFLPVKEKAVAVSEHKEKDKVKMKKEKPKKRKISKDSEAKKLKQLKVLFMDDEEDIRELAEDLGTQLGLEIKTVSNGQDAVEEYKKSMEENKPYHLVVVDLTVVGGMGGEEALVELKKINPDVKVIASSGYVHSGALADFSRRGFIDILPKPYDVKTFKEVILRNV